MKRGLFFILACLSGWSIYSQDLPGHVIVLDEQYSGGLIGKKMEVYKDYSLVYTLSDILTDTIQNLFSPNLSDIGNEGNSGARIWCKFQLENQYDDIWYLELGNPLLADISYYQLDAQGVIRDSVFYSSFIPFKERNLLLNKYYFPIKLSKNQKGTFYVSFIGTYPLDFPLKVLTMEHLVTE